MQVDPLRIEQIYTLHPLRAETILARVDLGAQGRGRITEADLATDEITRITDQNHPGGLAHVRELAREAGIGPGCRVLDVGCGLGGSARALAEEYSAEVDGVELTVSRHRDAVLLTKLIGLDDRVRILHGDFLTLDLPAKHYDVAWGQAAWVHFPNLNAVFARCAVILRLGGRVAVEEAYLRRRPHTPIESQHLAELEECWAAHLRSRDNWIEAVECQGFQTICATDLTTVLGGEAKAFRETAARGPAGIVNHNETRSWELAEDLILKGVLGYQRLVALLINDQPPHLCSVIACSNDLEQRTNSTLPSLPTP